MAAVRVTTKHVDRLLKELTDIAANWIVFMGQLEFPQARIKQIERDVPPGDLRSVECLRTALLQWISVNDNPTYDAIIAALKSPVLKEVVLARSVEAFSQRIQAEIGPEEIQFDVNMGVEELCQLLRQKGVDEEDCALFRSKGGDVSGSYGNSGGKDDPERLPNDPIWDEVPSLGYLQLLKWYDSQNKRQDLRLLRDLAPIWDKAAETLHLSAAEIRIIEKNNTGDQSGRIREVVVKWLSNGSMLPEADRYPVNWRGFFHLLLDAEQSDMAVTLKSALSANRSNIRKTF